MSPFYVETFYKPSWPLWIWEILNMPAVLAAVAFRSLGFAFFVHVVQWFIIGLCGTWIALHIREGRMKNAAR